MSSEKYTLVEGGILVKSSVSADIDEPYELFLDATAVRRSDDDFIREEKAKQILKLLDESNIGHDWMPGQGEEREIPDLEIQIGYTRVGYGIFRMSAEIARPKVSDEVASAVATQAMRQMAHDLGIYSDKHIPGLVYAQISGSQGMTFESNSAGSSSMDTDGMEYDATSERISLGDHNLYTHQMQLICISGLIALAKAR
jgi:hypothetical protein